jgi:subtilisin family serine protease
MALLSTWLTTASPAGATPGPPQAPEYWFDTWHVPSLWDSGARGQGVTIAEIDSGVNASLPELRGRILRGTDLGRSGIGHVDRDRDRFGHGTGMASIMVGRPGLFGITGLAPGAKILPVAVPLVGTTDANQSENLPAAIRYAADHGAKIINLSLGGRRSPRTAGDQPCPADEQSAVFHAIHQGAIVVASVGNTGPKTDAVEEPGVCLGVLSVGAVDTTGRVASFSSRQPYLSLVAPGVDVPSLGRVPGQAYSGKGTSQAAAIVSASLALVWSAYPHLPAQAIEARVLATLDSPHHPASSAYGHGMLDTYRAVTAHVAASTTDPIRSQAEPFYRRYVALGAPGSAKLGDPPPVAGSPEHSFGNYGVGTGSRFTTTVRLGIGLGIAGLVGLLLLTVGLRNRRRGRPIVELSLPPWPTVDLLDTDDPR